MPCLASWIEKKFLSGPARSPTATILPLRSASLSTPELVRDSTRMQPPCVPAAHLPVRAAVVDECDVECLLLEEAVIDCDRQRRKAARAGVPRQFQLSRPA